MTRKSYRGRPDNLTIIRRGIARIEAALDALPPERRAPLAGRLIALLRDLAVEETRRAEFEMDGTPEMRAQFAAEIEEMIEARVAERIQSRFYPNEHDYQRRAWKLEAEEGGDWRDYGERVRAEQREFLAGLVE